MEVLNPGLDLPAFWTRLRNSSPRALLLDYDGTLAPFRVERDQAFPYPGVREALGRLLRQGKTRLVVISGRSLAELRPLLGLEPPPELWGSHGGERLFSGGRSQKAALAAEAGQGLEAAAEWLAARGWGERLERKPFGLALHWRGLGPGEVAEIRAQAGKKLASLVQGTGLEVCEFDGGLELRPPGVTKGEAVERILAELAGPAAAAYLGDDLTDEDAFAALEGRGLSVLVRDERRPSRADLWLRPPEELLDFLRRWEEALA